MFFSFDCKRQKAMRYDEMTYSFAGETNSEAAPTSNDEQCGSLAYVFFESCIVKRFTKKRKTTRFLHSVLPFPEPRRRRLHLTSLGRKGVSMCFAFGLGLDAFCLFAFGQGRRRSATSEAGKTVEGKGGTREHTFQQIQAT